MIFELEKPIVFLDIESTGTNPVQDKIIQISAVKIFQNSKQELDILVNPCMPIKNSEIHGISNEMVRNKPIFSDVAYEVINFIDGCDIGVYNGLRFDIPILSEELLSCGINVDFSKYRIIDVFRIYQQLRPRNLAACYKEFTGKEMSNAHNALYDSKATAEIWMNMVQHMHIEPEVDVQIQKFMPRDNVVDLSGCFIYNDKKEILFNFGKHKGKSVECEPSYLNWMLNADFSQDTKNWINKIMANETQYQSTNSTNDDLPF